MTPRSRWRRGPLANQEDHAGRALRAWGDAEADALEAEAIAAREDQRARAAWRSASERHRRAGDAAAARQVAFEHGLLDAAEAHARAALAAEARALDARGRARALREEADGRRSVAREAEGLLCVRCRGSGPLDDRTRRAAAGGAVPGKEIA